MSDETRKLIEATEARDLPDYDPLWLAGLAIDLAAALRESEERARQENIQACHLRALVDALRSDLAAAAKALKRAAADFEHRPEDLDHVHAALARPGVKKAAEE